MMMMMMFTMMMMITMMTIVIMVMKTRKKNSSTTTITTTRDKSMSIFILNTHPYLYSLKQHLSVEDNFRIHSKYCTCTHPTNYFGALY